MKNHSSETFLIACNVLDLEQSFILRREAHAAPSAATAAVNNSKEYFDNDWLAAAASDEALSEAEINRFVGEGIIIYRCRPIREDEIADAGIGDRLELMSDDETRLFAIDEILFTFPRIESTLAPGIYQFYPCEDYYFAIPDKIALTRFFDEEPNFDCRQEKIICCSRGIATADLRDGDGNLTAEFENNKVEAATEHFRPPLPFDYFDVCCPLCDAKIITFETDSPADISCTIVERPCAHFVGHLLFMNNSPMQNHLTALGREYIWENGELFLQRENGKREKTVMRGSGKTSDESYWGGEDDREYQSRWAFLPSQEKSE